MGSEPELGLEFDHIPIQVDDGAPEVRVLQSLGFQHLGRESEYAETGMRLTSIYFANTYLEFQWYRDKAGAAAVFQAHGIDLGSRLNWRETGANPFFLALRRRAGAGGVIPYSAFEISSPAFPPGQTLTFLKDYPGEPLFLVVPDAFAYPAWRDEIGPVDHPLGVREVTDVRFIVNTGQELSPIARSLTAERIVTIAQGDGPLLELTFDEERQGKTQNLAPTLPLRIRY